MSFLTLRGICKVCKPNNTALLSVRKYANAEETKLGTAESDELQLMEKAEETIQDDVIMRLRNKSQLGPKSYRKFHEMHPLLNEDEKQVFSIARLRRTYGKYGSSSGIDVGLLWPSKEELELKQEWEKLSYPDNLPQMMETAKRLNIEEKEKILKRQDELSRKVAKLEEWKKEVRDRIANQERLAREAKEKKERVMEEVRQMFGFRMDPKDVRFQEALDKKEQEEKKAAKAAKKLKKQQKIIENIKKLAQEIPPKTQENTPSKEIQNTGTVPEDLSQSSPKS